MFYQASYHDNDAHVAAWANENCDTYHRAAFIAAVAAPAYAYSRNRYGMVFIYHRDPKSPTGVHCAIGSGDIAFADDVIREVRNNSPLSPTEGLNKSGAYLG